MIFADVSEFQSVDWARYGPAHKAVIVRAHNGWRADYKWQVNLAGARKFCAWRAFYQYLPKSVDPATAARQFAATVGPLQPGEVLILDLEEGDGDQRARRRAWYDAIPNVPKWTYSGLWFSTAHLPGVPLEWVAAYQSSEPVVPHLLWQNSSSASFTGIPGGVDSNIYNGTLDELIALTTKEADTLSDAQVEEIKQYMRDLVIDGYSVNGQAFPGLAAVNIENQKRITDTKAIASLALAEVRQVREDLKIVAAAVSSAIAAIKAVDPQVKLDTAALDAVASAAKEAVAAALSVDSASVQLNISSNTSGGGV